MVGLVLFALACAGCASVTHPADVLRACLHELTTKTPRDAYAYCEGGTANETTLQNLYEIALAGPFVFRAVTRDSVQASVVVHSPLRNVRVLFAKHGLAWMIASAEHLPPDSLGTPSARADPVMNTPVGAVAGYVRASYGDDCSWTITAVTAITDSTSAVGVRVPDLDHPNQDIMTSRIDGTWQAIPPRFFGR